MDKSNPPIQETNGSILIEAINQLNTAAPGAGVVVCQVCGDGLREGRRVTAYAFRPCCHSSWVVGQARCAEHDLLLSSLATLGVRELTVEGRVGRCVDQGMQRSWPVVVASEVLHVSPRCSSTVREVPVRGESGAYAACGCGPTGAAGVADERGCW
jgi:hypothetical protein